MILFISRVKSACSKPVSNNIHVKFIELLEVSSTPEANYFFLHCGGLHRDCIIIVAKRDLDLAVFVGVTLILPCEIFSLAHHLNYLVDTIKLSSVCSPLTLL